MSPATRRGAAIGEALVSLFLLAAFALALVPALHHHPPLIPDESAAGTALSCTLCAFFVSTGNLERFSVEAAPQATGQATLPAPRRITNPELDPARGARAPPAHTA